MGAFAVKRTANINVRDMESWKRCRLLLRTIRHDGSLLNDYLVCGFNSTFLKNEICYRLLVPVMVSTANSHCTC